MPQQGQLDSRQVKHISSPVISRLESMVVRRIRNAFFSKSDSLGVVLVLQYCLCAEPGWLQKLVWMKENMLRDFLPLVFQNVYKSCLLLFMDLFGLIYTFYTVASWELHFMILFLMKVIKEEREATKLRTIFDASSKITGPLLNECLFSRPFITANLFSILLCLSVDQIAMFSGIENVFLQIAVTEKHRNF